MDKIHEQRLSTSVTEVPFSGSHTAGLLPSEETPRSPQMVFQRERAPGVAHIARSLPQEASTGPTQAARDIQE